MYRVHGNALHYIRETGTICQIVVLTRKRCIFRGPKRSISGIWHYKNSEEPLQILSAFGGKQALKRHRPKYSQMLCFVVFGHLNPFDMIDVRSRPTSVSGLKHRFAKWYLFHAPTGICVGGGISSFFSSRGFPCFWLLARLFILCVVPFSSKESSCSQG